jgi:hypothetical protein
MRTTVKIPVVLSTYVMVQGKLKSTVSLAPVLRTYCFIDVV